MAKTRVYELARELGIESKDLLERVHELGVVAKTASSSLAETDADLIRLSYSEEREPVVEEPVDPPPIEAPPADVAIVTIKAGATVAEVAEALGVGPAEVVQALIARGALAGAGQTMPVELIEAVAEQFGAMVELEEQPPPPPPTPVVPALVRPVFDDDPSDLAPRPPVVTVMGHVDHGKTTLLDAIRHTKVVAGEHGGITQHIGAYQVQVGKNPITFIDTPGHEAFTAMRARGADVTDIVVLVVAADDGVMPQTVEAINHAKAAGVKMVVAINKMDLPTADPTGVRAMLTEHGVLVEELGGDIPSVEVSAAQGQGIDSLLEIIDLIAQIEDYKANPTPAASGVAIESQLDQGMGPLATVIVLRGTLRTGDAIVSGAVSGRVRAMMDHSGQRMSQATPSTPALVMGWDEIPTAGDPFEVTNSDREARSQATVRQEQLRDLANTVPTAKERLQNLLEQLRSEDEAELRLIIKADTNGSLEALRESIGKIKREGGRIEIIHGAVGGVNENDVTLADVTGAVIIGFNVRPDAKSRKAAEHKGVEIRSYRVIYELLDEIEQILVGRLAPEEIESVLGTAEVRAIFKVPRLGAVAGCYVTEGEMSRGARVRLLRDGIVVHDGKIGSLRRFKDDVRSVAAGFECGIGIEGYADVKEGDVIEAYAVREVLRD